MLSPTNCNAQCLSVNISCLIQFRANPCQPSQNRRTGHYCVQCLWDGLRCGDSSSSSSDLLRYKRCPSGLLGVQPLLCFRASLMGHDRLSPPYGLGGLSALRHAGALLDFSMPPCGTTSPSVTRTAPAPDWPRALPPIGRSRTRAVNQQAEPFRHVL